MPGRVVVLDANVLIPAALRDTLLRAAERRLYQLRWSDAILDEVSRNLIENHLTTEDDAIHLIDVMRSFFPEALVTGYESLIPVMENDPKDRHVLATAVHAKAQVIVTENLRDFPESTRSPYAIEAISSDQFLSTLLDTSERTMVNVIRDQAADLDAPPMTVDELLAILSNWAPMFVESIKQWLF